MKNSLRATKAVIAAMIILLSVSANAQIKFYRDNGYRYRVEQRGIVINGITHIAVPEVHRKRFGFDSIQLLVENGKIRANFSYPNNWLYAKDTVYTEDTAYRLWGFKVRLTPDLYLTTRASKHGLIMKNGFWDMTKPNWICDSVIIDSFKIKITKIPDTTSKLSLQELNNDGKISRFPLKNLSSSYGLYLDTALLKLREEIYSTAYDKIIWMDSSCMCVRMNKGEVIRSRMVSGGLFNILRSTKIVKVLLLNGREISKENLIMVLPNDSPEKTIN